MTCLVGSETEGEWY